MVTGVSQMQRNLLGSEPVTCPWRTLKDPLVRDVLEAYPLFESGQCSMMIGSDPPKRIVQALTCFHQALSAIDRDDWEREKKEREAKARTEKTMRIAGGGRG